ncbi:MAG: hypothetical protein QXT58_05065 [Archaeoglobaceae archaeon]
MRKLGKKERHAVLQERIKEFIYFYFQEELSKATIFDYPGLLQEVLREFYAWKEAFSTQELYENGGMERGWQMLYEEGENAESLISDVLYEILSSPKS